MRESINKYLAERCQEKQEPLQKKFDKLSDEEKLGETGQKIREQLDQLRTQFSTEHWLAGAAKRAAQVKQVTHVLKMTHPDAKGSSIYDPVAAQGNENLLATYTLGDKRDADAVGNAGALDVYKFLGQMVEGESLLEYARQRDETFLQALSDDSDQAQAWCDAFASLTEIGEQPASHPLAKQLYWPLNEGGYRILAPLASSSLSHAVFVHIQEERFSEAAQAARKAQRDGVWSERPVRYFPQLLAQKMGGSKPQNISLLTSQRGGINYLLPSLPPIWQARSVRLPLSPKTVFDRTLTFHGDMSVLLKALAGFLKRVPKDYNNLAIREKRAELIQALIDRVLEYGYQLQAQPTGWSSQANLDLAECRWLDPGRCQLDEEFARTSDKLDWADDIAQRFGHWLNAQMSRGGLPVGHPEFRQWQGEFNKDLAHEKSWLMEALQ